MPKQIDRRAARTRKALHQALMMLILRKGYDALTIQDIIDEADVGRSTFYGHYAGKEDLLRRGFETLRNLLKDAQRGATAKKGVAVGSHHDILGFSLALFEHASEYADIFQALVGGRGGIVAINEIRQIHSELVRKELTAGHDDVVPREIRIQFIVGTILTILTWWLERKSKLAPAQVDAIFRRLVMNGIGPVTSVRQNTPYALR